MIKTSNPSHEKPRSPIDFIIITALEEERDAMLSKLRGFKRLDKEADDIYTYYFAKVKSQRRDGSIYQVILACPLNMGPLNATALATSIIKKWNPRFVLLVGIACGIKSEVNYGDVMVATQIADYTLGKQENGIRRVRWEVYPSGPSLLDSANHINPKWTKKIVELRPADGSVKSVKGVIASGGDVISDDQVVAAYSESWQKLIGIEMESGGVAAGVHRTQERPEFLMIKSVSDFGKDKHDADVRPWRKYACHTAAAFTLGLIKSGPSQSLLSIHEKQTKTNIKKERIEAAERRWDYIQNHPIKNIAVALFLKTPVGFDWFRELLSDVRISFSRDQSSLKIGEVLKNSCEPNTKESDRKSEIPISSFWEIYDPEDGYWVKRIKPIASSFKLVAGFDSLIPWSFVGIPDILNLQDLASLENIGVSLPPQIFQSGVEELIFRIDGETFSFSVFFSDNGLEFHHEMASTFHRLQQSSAKDAPPLYFSMGFQGIQLLDMFRKQMMPDYKRASKKEGIFGGQAGPNGNSISFYPSMPMGWFKTTEANEYSFTVSVPREIDYQKTIKELEKLIRDNERNKDAYLQLASVFSLQGRSQDVINCLSTAVTKVTPTSSLYGLLGEAYYKLGRYDEALIQFREAASLTPDDSNAQLGIAFTLQEIGDDETALSHFEKAVLLKPENAYYQSSLSRAFLRLERNTDAIVAAKRAVKLAPEDTENMMLLGILLHFEGHYDEALMQIGKAVEMNPDSAKVNRQYAQILEMQGHFENSIGYYKHSLELKKDADCFAELGRVMCNLERWSEAESVINEGLSFDPDHCDLIYVLAATKANQGNFDDSLEQLTKAIKIDPNNVQVKELLAQVNSHLGKL